MPTRSDAFKFLKWQQSAKKRIDLLGGWSLLAVLCQIRNTQRLPFSGYCQRRRPGQHHTGLDDFGAGASPESGPVNTGSRKWRRSLLGRRFFVVKKKARHADGLEGVAAVKLPAAAQAQPDDRETGQPDEYVGLRLGHDIQGDHDATGARGLGIVRGIDSRVL